MDAQQGRSLDEFILYDWDLLRTLGALNENDYYARVLCVCVSFDRHASLFGLYWSGVRTSRQGHRVKMLLWWF